MEKKTFTVSCKNQKDFDNKQLIIHFFETLSEKKQIKFVELIESLKQLL